MGPKAFNVTVNYSFFGEGTGAGEFSNREEITTGFTSELFDDWILRGSTRRDLQRDETLNYGLGLEYRCDCLHVAVDFTRTFTTDRDLKPSDTVFVRLTFKNLGEFGGAVGQ